MSAVLAAAIALEQARILAVRSERVGSRQAVSVVTSAALPGVGVRRDGNEVILTLAVSAAAALEPPAAAPPIEAIRIGREADGFALRVQVAREVPYAVRREGTRLTVLFGEESRADPAPQGPGSDVDQLYRGLFPPSSEPLAVSEPAGPMASAAGAGDQGSEGLRIGALSLRPAVSVSYVDGESAFLDTPQPTRDQYFQVEPRVAADLPFLGGQITADYAPRFRRGSAFSIVEETSHFAGASLEIPTATFSLRLSERYAKGILETYEVDPGGEYFFQLGPYERNSLGGELRLGRGGRLALEGGGDYTKVDVGSGTGFFDYESWTARGGLGYEASPSLHVSLLYGYQRVPASPQRAESDSRAHSLSLNFDGDILPLITGRLSVGYTDQRSPKAASGGTSFSGLTLGASLRKEFTPATAVALGAERATRLSAFEDNAFYVSNAGLAQLTAPLLLGFALNAGAGYHWNEYRTAASALGRPREDRIFGWSVGVGRAVTRRAYVRADYRREQRSSNVDAFDITTDALVVQLGIGFFGGAGR